jgi:hypothetical protein
MKYGVYVLALLFVAGFAFGADVDGKWTGSVPGMDGNPINIQYTFKAEGNTLTGTTKDMEGKDIAIKNGKIDGNNISFTVTFDMMGQEFTMNYKGVVSGDQIKLTFDMMGQPSELVLKRAK